MVFAGPQLERYSRRMVLPYSRRSLQIACTVREESSRTNRMSENLWYLKRCDLFERLIPEQIQRIESRCRIRKVARNEPIYLPADCADGVILLAAGRVKLCGYTPDGKQSILAFIEPGEIFGELAIFEPGDRDEYAEAVLASTLLLIPADEMLRAIEEHPAVSLGVTKLIGLRRRRIERRLKYLLFHSNRERLVHLLLELVEQYGKPTTEGLELGIKLSHQDLANIIGATRETVTVTLGELQAGGFVRLGRQKVTVTDLDRLARIVHVETPPSKQLLRQDGPASPFSLPQSGKVFS
jgi:CRP/FNR family cyclic AMP-dependent transcriptional regulator